MNKKLLSILILICLCFIVVFPLTALAAIPSPSAGSPVIHPSVNVYHHVLETDDQLFIISFTCDYGVNPTEGNLTDLFLVRLLTNAGVEIRAIQPFSYFDDGYNYGVASIYFTAAEVTALGMTWNPALPYIMKFEGNPSLVWAASPPPNTQISPFTYSSATTTTETSEEIRLRVIALATSCEAFWGATTDMITYVASVPKLVYDATYNGDAYFTSVIANLRVIAPTLFLAVLENPEQEERGTISGTSYFPSLENRTVGTPFDMTNLAVSLGVDRILLSSLVWLALSALVAFGIATKMNNTKTIPIFIMIFTPFGLLLGFMSWMLTVAILSFFAIVAVFVFFYSRAG